MEWGEREIIRCPENETEAKVVFKIISNPKPLTSEWKIKEKVIETGGSKVDVFQASNETNLVVSQYLLSVFINIIPIVY